MFTPKNNIAFILFFLYCSNILISQNSTLSQNTNYYLFQASNNQLFIGSLDGLNIYNGRKNKIYRPSSHNMIGSNIQSEFYEDLRGHIWFTTYQALHCYVPENDAINFFQFEDNNLDLLEIDYRIIHQSIDTIWVQAGDFTILYNTKTKVKLKKFCSEVPNFHTFYKQKNDKGFKLIAGNANGDGIDIITFNENYQRIRTDGFNGVNVYGLKKVDDCILIATSFTGEAVLFNHCTNSIQSKKQIDTSGIHKIDIDKNGEFIFYSTKSGIFKYDRSLNQKTGVIFDPKIYNLSDKSLIEYHNLSNDFMMVSIVGEGVIPISLKRTNIFDSSLDKAFEQKSISNCFPLTRNQIILTNPSDGNFICNLEDLSIEKFSPYGDKVINALVQLNDKFLFSIVNQLFELDSNKVVRKVNISSSTDFKSISSLTTINDRIFCLINYKLLELIENEKPLIFRWNVIKELENLNITGICRINNTSALLSINNEYIVKLKFDKSSLPILSDPIKIKGSLKDFFILNDSCKYVSTSSGLYKIEKYTNEIEKLSGKNGILNQTIYAIKSDSIGNLWLSSNSGILKYNPETEEIYQYGLKHRIQSLEYNTGAHFQTEDGHILFGGMKGLDYFHPDSITLSNYQSPIYFSSFLVNEETYPEQTAQTLDTVILPFNQNTLTFGFHAIDYSDPHNTLTKYKLVGKDNVFSKETSADGSARYSNLDPGDYIFTVMGANSDHVWNPNPRTLHITILPPWYATWWARSLGVLLIVGLIYFTIRSYYKRQIREKDLALREANLTISQQNALSEERTRIAAEMHDDLGGGLTSIRFLSQKVFRTVTNEGLKTQVSKIVNLSEGLVNNMSEIIWAMDAGFDSLSSLISYVRRYAHEYLEDYDIDLSFIVERRPSTGIPLSGNQRRNIFLVIKEAIHNAVKHAKASKLKIRILVEDVLIIEIIDNGIGLNENFIKGNGMKNMERRVKALGGNILISEDDGLNIKIHVPFS